MVKLSIFAVIAAVTAAVLADSEELNVGECVVIDNEQSKDIHINCCYEAGGETSENECKYNPELSPSVGNAFEGCCARFSGTVEWQNS